MTQPIFERWGNAVMNCNYSPFKRVSGERERSSATLPCGRSVCSRCKAVCGAQPAANVELNMAA